MSGTTAGGLKAQKTNKERYGEDFYRQIGASGGRKSSGGGFAANPELAKEAGRKGGKASRRVKAKATHVPVEVVTAIEDKANWVDRLIHNLTHRPKRP